MGENIIEHITAQLPIGPETKNILIQMYNLQMVHFYSDKVDDNNTMQGGKSETRTPLVLQ
jgi:hypothetical protein